MSASTKTSTNKGTCMASFCSLRSFLLITTLFDIDLMGLANQDAYCIICQTYSVHSFKLAWQQNDDTNSLEQFKNYFLQI